MLEFLKNNGVEIDMVQKFPVSVCISKKQKSQAKIKNLILNNGFYACKNEDYYTDGRSTVFYNRISKNWFFEFVPENKDNVVFIHDGDFFTIKDDIQDIANFLDLTVVTISGKKTVSIPAGAIDSYISKILQIGYQVAVQY